MTLLNIKKLRRSEEIKQTLLNTKKPRRPEEIKQDDIHCDSPAQRAFNFRDKQVAKERAFGRMFDMWVYLVPDQSSKLELVSSILAFLVSLFFLFFFFLLFCSTAMYKNK